MTMMAPPASASEGGTNLYLLGSGGPGAAVLPPLKGVYLDNTVYIYSGDVSADRDFVLGGRVVAGLDAVIVAEFSTFMWVPSMNISGGTLVLGAALPIGVPMVTADAVLTGPRGQQIDVSRRDSTMTYGDPIVTAMMGWKTGNLHVTLAGLLNVPVGDYREGELANIAFHRWAGDASLALSMHDPKSGWDVSGKAGVTFNGTNDVTDYKTGTEFHLEAAVEKALSPKFSAGVLGYYYHQLSGDSGSGAVLGPNKGEVVALGGTVAFNTVLGRSPATFRLRVLQEFDATRRMEGTAALLSLTLPLHMQLPTGAPE